MTNMMRTVSSTAALFIVIIMSSTFLSCQARNCKQLASLLLLDPKFHFEHSWINQFNQQIFLGLCFFFQNLQASAGLAAPLVPRHRHRHHHGQHGHSGDAIPLVMTPLRILMSAVESAMTWAASP
jgi:hypothetical protein